MHRAACAWCGRRHGARARGAGGLRTGALEDRAAALGNAWSGGRGGVDRARAGLRHDDAADGRSCGSGGLCGCFYRLGYGGCFDHRGRRRGSYWLSHGCGGYWGFDWRSRRLGHRRSGNDRSGCGRDGDRRTRDDRADGRLARDCGRSGWRDDIGSLTREGNNAARRGRSLGSGIGRGGGWGDGDPGRCRGCRDSCGRRYDCGWARRRGFRCGFGLLALEDGFERVAGLGDLGEVELRFVVDGLPACGAASAAVLEVLPDPFGLVGFDRAGVGLSGHADCFERVQNWPALYFQFPCQIVDSNFAHPSLFASLARLAVHISLIER
jgi:hypothetical protein